MLQRSLPPSNKPAGKARRASASPCATFRDVPA